VRFGLAVDSSPGPLTAPYHLYLPLVTRNFDSPHSASAYTVALAAPGPYRPYDITDPDYPVRLTAFTLAGGVVTLGETDSTWADGRVRVVAAESAIAAPERLRRAAPPPPIGGADYLVLAHSDFIPALAPLITLRQSQGLSVGVVDVRAVYDAHDGRPTPEAIRAYLANAYANWNPRPTYVLLVGDGTYDPKHYRANSSATFIPPYLADVDPRAGETAADNRYVTLDGGDALPDMLIGRLPVNTLAEAQTVVDKIVQYETRPFPGGWNSNVVFVADNPDTAGDFAAESAALAAAYIASPFTAWPIYYPSPTTPAESFHQDILSRWNSGAGLILFNGHASDLQWAAERLFHRDDAPALSNGPRLPVVAEMTCFTGSFHVPDYATLDETLLRHPDGGAVAVWGATGLGVATGHTHLANGFLASLYQQGQAGLGAAALAGKLNLAQSGNYPDLLDTYMLFGDPATQADLTLAPWASAQYLPLIQR